MAPRGRKPKPRVSLTRTQLTCLNQAHARGWVDIDDYPAKVISALFVGGLLTTPPDAPPRCGRYVITAKGRAERQRAALAISDDTITTTTPPSTEGPSR